MARQWLTACVAVMAASSTAAQAAPDPAFCRVLQDFVRSVRPDEAREITFRTSWGHGFDGSPDRLAEKACSRHDDEPSIKLCAYLVQHGSAEFTDVTVKHALMCLSPKTRFARDLTLKQGTFSFSVGKPDRGAWVEASFGDDREMGGKVFRLKAEGY